MEIRILPVAVALGLLAAACKPTGAPQAGNAAPEAAVASPAVVPDSPADQGLASGTKPPLLTPSGSAAMLPIDDGDVLQDAAGVTDVQIIGGQGDLTAKLFGLAGGDPAMNGLNLQIAFFDSPAEGWKVYRIGDFLEYRVLNVAPGRVDLEIEESVMAEDTGRMSSRKRRLIIGWTPTADGTPPAGVTVTPAT